MPMYDFDRIINRRGTHSDKWDRCSVGEIPLHYADMDFSCAPEIIEALQKRVGHGIFGYTYFADQDLYDAVQLHNDRYGWKVTPDSLVLSNGVVSALGHIAKIITPEDARCLSFYPVYGPIYMRPQEVGREVVFSNLESDERGYGAFNYQDIENKLRTHPDIRFVMLCNPHNPFGRVYTFEELRLLGEICARYDVWIVSDEIHRDITRRDIVYTPMEKAFPEYKEKIVTCFSPSKSFNLAGMVYSLIVINDPGLRSRWREYVNRIICLEEHNTNVLSLTAMIAAFSKGGLWLDAMREYLDTNYCALEQFLKKELPKIHYSRPEGTYFAWIDFSPYLQENPAEFFRKEAGVLLGNGKDFGSQWKGYVRTNIACPKSLLIEGFEKIAASIHKAE